MTPISGMLAVFAYKNKVVQIQIQVSHVEAVFTRVEFVKTQGVWAISAAS